jgi:pimeloyl-ACP methyl ester carboxylesterase
MTPLHHEISGAGDAVLLLHGLGLDLRMWDDQVQALSARYRLVRVDLLGFGRSPPVAGPYSHGEQLQALLDALGVARAHIVGLSMGGRIAAEFVQWHPERARSLALVDADITGLPFRTLGPLLGPIFAAGKAGDIAAAKRMFHDLPLFAPARRDPGVAARLRRMLDEYSGWHFANMGAGLERRPAVATADALHEFALPTLALVGELDAPDFHDQAEGVVARVPGARKAVIGGTGHMPNMENPAAFNKLMLEFLERAG